MAIQEHLFTHGLSESAVVDVASPVFFELSGVLEGGVLEGGVLEGSLHANPPWHDN